MNDESAEGLRNLTVEEAIKLKHDLNQQITYGIGLNARQVSELERLTRDQYTEMRRQISAIPRSWWAFPNYVLIGVFLLGGVGLFLFRQWGYQIAALLAMLYSAGHLSYRSGLLFGYAEGYEAGNIGGVRKALRITPEEADDIHNRSIEMEIDAQLIDRLGSKTKHETG